MEESAKHLKEVAKMDRKLGEKIKEQEDASKLAREDLTELRNSVADLKERMADLEEQANDLLMKTRKINEVIYAQ